MGLLFGDFKLSELERLNLNHLKSQLKKLINIGIHFVCK